MATTGNVVVSSKLATLFGSEQQADCAIEFYQEPLSGEGDEPSAKRQKLEAGLVAGATAAEPGDVDEDAKQAFGGPLPAHSLLLRCGSEWFRGKFDLLEKQKQQAAAAALRAPASSKGARGKGRRGSAAAATAAADLATAPRLPVLRVPLGSAAEVPSARAAIQYIYTGRLSVDTIRAALEVWRQAHYLQIEGCAGDCLQLISSRLAAAPGGGGGGRSDEGSGDRGSGSSDRGGSPSSAAADLPPVLELYACEWMWRDIEAGPAFDALLASAKPLLVSHFGDTLACLNRPSLRQQLLALPAAGLEVLLKSDDFGTDTEDSVLLLLATWMRENRGSTDASTRERLCRMVRLAQLSPAIANAVLPALGFGTDDPWFPPMSRCEASVITSFANATTDRVRGKLRELAADCELNAHGSAWYSTRPRRQCLPPATAGERGPHAYDWALSEQRLRESLRGLQKHGDTLNIFKNETGHTYARGFQWLPWLEVTCGEATAGLFLMCSLPEAYQLRGSWLSATGTLPALAQVDARLEVHRWRGGVREVAASATFAARDYFTTCRGLGRPKGIRLQRPQGVWQAADGNGSGNTTAASSSSSSGGGDPLAPWAEYLHEGKIWGRLVLLPRSSA